MGNSRSDFADTFTSTFNNRGNRGTKMSGVEQGSFVNDEDTPLEALEERLREKNEQNNQQRNSRTRLAQSRQRRRSVSVDVRSLRRQSSAVHENLVKINFVRNIRDVYSGVDSTSTHLGEGTWGQVKLVKRRSNPRAKAAVKILKLSKDMKSSRMKELRSEISLLQKIDHPHIAKLYETYEEEGCNLYLVMEYLSGGELFDRVITLGHFKEIKAAESVKQMVGAVQYLHSKGIVHRDLKLENFMYRSKNGEQLVLIDFGLSTRYAEFQETDSDEQIAEKSKRKKFLNEMVGSSYYMAPEVMKRKYGRECDLWSLGVIAYMLLSGHPPFAGDSDDEIMKRVRKGKYNFDHAAFNKVSDSAKDFVSKLLVYEPRDRYSAKEAIQHPWLSDHHKKIVERRSQRRGSVMDGEVVENLKNFVNTNRFKRLALQAVAYSTRYEDIAHLQELFEEIDQDQDGYITLNEFENALKGNPSISPEFVKKAFQAMDIDRTQKIHLNEFIAATMNKSFMDDERILREAFRKLDMNETGEISREDVSELLGRNFSPEQIDKLFKEFMQVSGNGKVTKLTVEDFISAMRKVRLEETEGLMAKLDIKDEEEAPTEISHKIRHPNAYDEEELSSEEGDKVPI